MTLVVGATGLLGMQICHQLKRANRDVHAFVRQGSIREGLLETAGVPRIYGDLKEPSSVRRACDGQRVVISTATATTTRRRGDTLRTVDRDGQLGLVEAARHAGVRRFVYVSVSPNASPRSEVVVYKREVERAVRASGMEWVILQPCAFMDVWLSPRLGWHFAEGRVRIIGTGEQPVSLIALADVATFCTRAAIDGIATNRDVPLGGPRPVTPLDVVRSADALLQRSLRIQRVPTAIIRIASTILRPIAPVLAALLALGVDAAEHGDVIEMTATAREFSMTLTTIETYLASVILHARTSQHGTNLA